MSEVQELPKCVAIAEAGLTNSQQTIRYLSALIADGSAGRVTSGMMHGTCNAIGKMLRVVELEARFGVMQGSGQEKILEFVQSSKSAAKEDDPRVTALAKLTQHDRAILGLT